MMIAILFIIIGFHSIVNDYGADISMFHHDILGRFGFEFIMFGKWWKGLKARQIIIVPIRIILRLVGVPAAAGQMQTFGDIWR
jgi:hypothetical protein